MSARLYARTASRFLQLPLMLAAFVFLPAGTLRYWQAWVFSIVFIGCSAFITVYLAANDPQLLERRLSAGPSAEKRRTQKTIMVLALSGFVATCVVPGLDHRFGWSSMSAAFAIVGDILVVLGFATTFRVFKENSYGASTVQLAPGQTVIATGPYAIVRHPMYTGGLVLLLGMPLALGSWWGLLTFPLNFAVILSRLLDEERFLGQNLPGYRDYMKQVPYRLLPFIG